MHFVGALVLWLILGGSGGKNSKYMMKQGCRAGRRMF